MKRTVAALCLAACGLAGAQAQTGATPPVQPAQTRQPAPPASSATAGRSACPAPDDLTPLHLYGMWRAQVEGAGGKDDSATAVTLWFERHAELAGSVSGRLVRNGTTAQLAGDVDNGEFNIEESLNGRNISATWSGLVVAGSCGKEIRGTWTDAASNASRSFVLRKQAGWQ